MKINVLFLVPFLLLSSFLKAQDEFTLAKEGHQAPDFSFENRDGEQMNFSELKGKVIWITFFATWCGPCRKELPHLEKEVYEKYKNHPDFQLLVVGREHTREELNKFQKETGYNLPFIADPKREIYSKYAAQNIPRNFIIDKKGIIKVSSTGFTMEDFKDKIKKMEELLKVKQ